MSTGMAKLIVFDCDSTLSEIEGVDELARAKGEAVFEQCVQLTNDAMGGVVPISDVFGKRLDLIEPSQALCEEIGQLYIKKIEPTAMATVQRLKEDGWDIVILSGGFKEVIQPFAQYLNIEHVEAVPLHFKEDGSYAGFDEQYPTTRNGGKPEVMAQLVTQYKAEIAVMVGDGVSDLEVQSEKVKFIGFGGFTERAKVKDAAQYYVHCLEDIFKYF